MKNIYFKFTLLLFFILTVGCASSVKLFDGKIDNNTQNDVLRNHIMRNTPLGSDKDSVYTRLLKVAGDTPAVQVWKDDRNGARRRVNGKIIEVVGTSHITAFLGPVRKTDYGFVLHYIVVEWAFDEQGKLIDVLINRFADGP